MKKINIYILLIIISLTSCNDEDGYLDLVPDGIATIDQAFTTEKSTRNFLYTCYSFLRNPTEYESTPEFLGAGEIWVSAEQFRIYGNYIGLIATGLQNVTDPAFDGWNHYYDAINICNVFLDGIDGVKAITTTQRKKWAAEVKFLKGYYHWMLIKMYGPIILNKKNLDVDTDYNIPELERKTIDESFSYVIELIDEAIVDLPTTYNTPISQAGRINGAIALAMKAKILATAASPLYNGNQLFASMVSRKGIKLFPDYDATKWQKAADACKVAIETIERTGKFNLVKSVSESQVEKKDSIDNLNFLLRERITGLWNNELIWGSTYYTGRLQSDGTPRMNKANTTKYLANMNLGVSLAVAEAYYTNHGVPMNEDKSFNYASRYELRTATDSDNKRVKSGEQTVKMHFNREHRFYADLGFDRNNWHGNIGNDEDNEYYTIKARKTEEATSLDLWQQNITGYFAKKFVSLKSAISAEQYRTSDYAYPLFRLSDLYLLYSECLNEVKDNPDAEVYKWIDKVRDRAGLKGVVEAWSQYSNNPTKPLNKEGMREIIKRERIIELSLEGHKFWDIRRWMDAPKYVNGPLLGWTMSKSSANEFYQPEVKINLSFGTRDYFWPIKEADITKNPLLVQNLFW